MEYCITIERIQTIKVRFSESSDTSAEEHAGTLFEHAQKNPSMFSNGKTEYDYALHREDGKTIFELDRFD